MNLRALLGNLPEIIQYILVLGIVMLILYVCLTVTRIFGKGKGNEVRYDDPEAYEKTVPDLFASTFLKRKVKDESKADEEKQD